MKISYKGEVDIVTQADKRSEQAIVSRLRTHFPKHAIVAEEGGGTESDSPFRWHVDPLDGTTNFAHGYPCFCVSLGLEEAGELIVGVIFQPVTGELFTAVKGEGAYLNQKKIEVSRIEKLATSLLATGFPSVKRAQNPNIHYYWDFTLRSHGVRRDGSAAMDLAAVACGRFEGFWEFGLHTWDAAAGVLASARGRGHRDSVRWPAVPAGRPGAAGFERPSPSGNERRSGKHRRTCGVPGTAFVTGSLLSAGFLFVELVISFLHTSP